MRRVMLVLMMVMVIGCGNLIPRYYWEESKSIGCANWMYDNNICFVEVLERREYRESMWGEELVGSYKEVYVCEVGVDGIGLRVIDTIMSGEEGVGEPVSISSGGEWIVVSVGKEWDEVSNEWDRGEIYVGKRDGTGFERVGTGINADFSPDASKIVYEKPDSGIWVMDRDGSNNHCIVSDPDAKYPAWSPDDSLIAYGEWWTHIVNLDGDSIKVYQKAKKPDWGPAGSNKIITFSYFFDPMEINIETDEIDTISYFKSGDGIKWSPDGLWFIAYDGDWFVISADGTNKWYLKDLIE